MSEFEELADIWKDVTDGTETTTEEQSERTNRRDVSDFDGRIRDTVEEMRDRFDIRSELSDDRLAIVVRGFFDGESDREIARRLGDKTLDKSVKRARICLHLLRDGDTETEVDLDALDGCLAAGNSASVCGDRLGIAKSTANRYRRILRAERQSERVDHEYRERFRRYCDDDELEDMQKTAQWDGLEDAVAGAGADNRAL